MVQLYGLKNCDRCRAARKWLDKQGLSAEFSDLAERPPGASEVAAWAKALGFRKLLNRRSLSWRSLPPARRDDLDERAACQLIVAEPRLIKRPLLVHKGQIHVGFTPEQYAAIFGISRP